MFELPEYIILAKQMNETLKGKSISKGVLGTLPHKFAYRKILFHRVPEVDTSLVQPEENIKYFMIRSYPTNILIFPDGSAI